MTKKITLALSLAVALIAFGAAPALGQTATLTCTPTTSVATPGQSVNFIVTGGTGTYAFAGTGITATTTTSNLFTASFPNAGVQNFTVTSGGQTANCNVNIVAAGGLTCSVPSGPVSVGQNATFTATGGNGSFTWSATDLTISNPTGTSFTANYTTPGVHFVTVTSAGSAATCALNVLPASVPNPTPVVCSPATQTATVGQAVSFTATGGNGTYVWSATDLTLNNPTGSGFTANYGSSGTHIVTVTSGASSASCTVNILPVSTPGLPNTGYAPAI